MALKTQVILYLIGHLEDYSVDSLALLPPPLRRELLLNVPALDVHKLEGTALFDGIDNEHIWKNLYHNHGYGFSDLYVQRKKSFMSQSPCYEPPDDVVIDHQVSMCSSKFIDYFALPHIPGQLSAPEKIVVSWKERYLCRIFEMELNYYHLIDDSCTFHEHKINGGLFSIISPYLVSEDRCKLPVSIHGFGLKQLCANPSCIRYVPLRYSSLFSSEDCEGKQLNELQSTVHYLLNHFHFKPSYIQLDCNELLIRVTSSREAELQSDILFQFLSEVTKLIFTCSLPVLSTSDKDKLNGVINTIKTCLTRLSSPLQVVRHQPFASPPFAFFHLVYPHIKHLCYNSLSEVCLSFDHNQTNKIIELLQHSKEILRHVSLCVCQNEQKLTKHVCSNVTEVLLELFTKPQFQKMVLADFSFSNSQFIQLLSSFCASSNTTNRHLVFGGVNVSIVTGGDPQNIMMQGSDKMPTNLSKSLTISDCKIQEDIWNNVVIDIPVYISFSKVQSNFSCLGGEYLLFTNSNVCVENLHLFIMSCTTHSKHLGEILSNSSIKQVDLVLLGFWGIHPATQPNIVELKHSFSGSCGSLKRLRFATDINNCNVECQRGHFEALLCLGPHLTELHLVMIHTVQGLMYKKNKKTFAEVFYETYNAVECRYKLKQITVGVDENTKPSGSKNLKLELLKKITNNVVIKMTDSFSGWFD